MSKKLLAGPYLLWMAGFIIIPLALIVYYGVTDKSGAFTLANIMSMATPEHRKALWLSLELSFISTVICLILAYPLAMILRNRGMGQGSFYPSHVDELSVKNSGMADSAGKKRCHQWYFNRPAPAPPEPD